MTDNFLWLLLVVLGFFIHSVLVTILNLFQQELRTNDMGSCGSNRPIVDPTEPPIQVSMPNVENDLFSLRSSTPAPIVKLSITQSFLSKGLSTSSKNAIRQTPLLLTTTTKKMKNLFLATVLALLAAACLVSAQSHLDKPVHDAFLIERINRDSSIGWTATKYAKFSDMSLRDARKMLGTVLIDPVHNLPKKSVLSARAPAQSFDARTKWGKCVHAIRDQQQCGSCWAFSASEVLSDRFCIASNGTIDVILSPEYMLQCDTSDYGCDGGYLNNAWNFLATTGIPTDNCDPYTSGGGDVGSCPTACNNGAAIKLYKAKNPQQLNTITDIQNDLQQNGPVQAAFSVYQDFFSCKFGLFE